MPSSARTLIRSNAKLLQSWPTLCDPMDSSLPGSSVPGTLQARILEGCLACLQGLFPTASGSHSVGGFTAEPPGSPKYPISLTKRQKIYLY